jgi:hypothetical protein
MYNSIMAGDRLVVLNVHNPSDVPLIAAAPDLLAVALRIADPTTTITSADLHYEVVAAIDKALGKSQDRKG